jgi:hypothetical protein
MHVYGPTPPVETVPIEQSGTESALCGSSPVLEAIRDAHTCRNAALNPAARHEPPDQWESGNKYVCVTNIYSQEFH